MKRYFAALSYSVILAIVVTSCGSNENKTEKETTMKEPQLKEENITYAAGNVSMNGFLVYDGNKTGARPAIIVIPEWWGLNDYAKMRARELAKLGYVAMAMDIYGDGKTADNPDSAQKLAMPFYTNPQIGKERFEAALAKLKTYPETDSTQLGAIGYCFGGAQAINMAKYGEPLKAVVSFHGNLTVIPANKDLLKAQILVCHGADDPYVAPAEVEQFKKQMDSIGASYIFKSYPGAVHAFTNPNATAMGEKFHMSIRYNAAADTASWNDMKDFFGKIFTLK
jgi:dienelactone hydrolase